MKAQGPVVCDAGTRYVQMSVCASCGAQESGWYRENIYVPSLLPQTAEERDFFVTQEIAEAGNPAAGVL